MLTIAETLDAHAGSNITAGWQGSPDPSNPRNIRRVCKCGDLIGRLPYPKKDRFRLGGDPFDAPHLAHIADVLAAREAAAAEQARAEVAAAHGVAWQDRLNIICLCGAVCSADMGKSPAPLMGSKSDYYVRTPAAQRFAQHLRDTRAALATEPTP